MNFSNYLLSLDIHETESGLSLRAKKGDSIRKIYVTLMDGGAPYRITPDCTAAFTARKPDNTILFNNALIENNAIVYELTPQTTASAGQVRCEVRLYGGDGRLITSPRFFLDVDDTVFTEGDQVVSDDEYTVLEDAIAQVDQAVADARASLAALEAEFREKVENGQLTDAVSAAFLHKTGGTMAGDIAMDGHHITGLAEPEAPTDAATKACADAAAALAQAAQATADAALPRSGGAMTGPIAMGGSKITGLAAPSAPADAVTKAYADAKRFTASAALGTGWSASAPYTQTVPVPGLLETDIPHVAPVYDPDPAAALAQREAWAMVCQAEAGTDSLTFAFFENCPGAAVPIQIEVMR